MTLSWWQVTHLRGGAAESSVSLLCLNFAALTENGACVLPFLQLTFDLFRSHLDMSEHLVAMKSSDVTGAQVLSGYLSAHLNSFELAD